jgi:hypothetical protein
MLPWVLTLLCSTFVTLDDKTFSWDFEDAAPGLLPKGWVVARTGEGKGSAWQVAEDQTAPRGSKTLVQTAESPSPMFNLCVVEDSKFQDGTLSVSFKALKGKTDQGGGIFWRYLDANNYYVARYNPLENNYRLYHVVGGKRTQFGGKEGLKAPAGEWHTLKVDVRDDSFTCYLNGKVEIESRDGTFTKPGKVGLWTKADAQTAFDGFEVVNVSK